MWTGDKVIPEVITKESIQELGEVLNRKPVIWDNIHANDYDQRRVFLGAYYGRPVELYPYLNGILTNPNCEFEANYIAIHTLGTWCRVAVSTFNEENEPFDDVQMADLTDDDCDTSVADVASEDCEMPVDLLPPLTAADVTSIISKYDSKEALKLAIQDWLLEFSLPKKAPLKSYSKRNLKTTMVNGQTILTATPYNLDVTSSTKDTINSMSEDKNKCMVLTVENLMLLTEMFCLPYEHGENGNKILEEFEWLLENVSDIYEQPPSKEKVSHWFDRLLHCDQNCQQVYSLFENFCKIPNEAILYDLYPYLWDLKEVVLALDAYVHWLSDSITSNLSIDNLKRSHLPANLPLHRFSVMSDFTEPWHVKYLGGLTVALHRLLPFKGGYIYLDQAPDVPSSNVVKIRTFDPSDKDRLYKYCNKNIKDISDDIIATNDAEKCGDQEVGSFMSICPKTLFLVEDSKGLCGYIAAVPDNKYFSDQLNQKWLPEMRNKYEKNEKDTESLFPLSEDWKLPTASHLVMNMDSKVHNECAFRRILNSVFSVLKTSGSTTVYHKIENDYDLDLFIKLGFFVDDVQEKLVWRAL